MQYYENMEDLCNSQWMFIILSVRTQITTDTGMSDYIQNSLCGIEVHLKIFARILYMMKIQEAQKESTMPVKKLQPK